VRDALKILKKKQDLPLKSFDGKSFVTTSIDNELFGLEIRVSGAKSVKSAMEMGLDKISENQENTGFLMEYECGTDFETEGNDTGHCVYLRGV
jgi:hypothetical protein